MWLIAQMKSLDALIKDMKSVLLYPVKKLWRNSVFVRRGLEVESQVEYFRKLSTDFNKQGLKWKLITSPSYIKKNIIFFSSVFCQHISQVEKKLNDVENVKISKGVPKLFINFKTYNKKPSIKRSLCPFF